LLFAAAALGITRGHEEIDVQVAFLSQRIREDPDDPVLRLRRAELHRVHRDWPAALADLRQANRLDLGLSAVYRSLGRLLYEADFPALSLSAFDRFLAMERENAAGFLARARAFLKLGARRAAVEDFDRGIDQVHSTRGPQPDDYLDRARALAAEGPHCSGEAIRGLDDGLTRLGGAVALQLYAIELEVRRGCHEAALDRLSTLEARSPRKEAWLARRGEVLADAGRFQEAHEAFERALGAIATLPEHRRRTKLTADLEARIRSALSSLRTTAAEAQATRP
jgi:tetratricopeptide (TPR) repeat protein